MKRGLSLHKSKFLLFLCFFMLIMSQTSYKPARPMTEVEVASMNNNLSEVMKLVKEGKPINPPSTEQGFPLLYAVFHDNYEMAKFLIEAGAKVDEKMTSGLTPLALAVARNQVVLVQLLIDKGADPFQTTNGNPVLRVAEEFRYIHIIGILKVAQKAKKPETNHSAKPLSKPAKTPKVSLSEN